MKKSNLDHLLQRYLTGQISEQERVKLEAWLDVKKTDEGTRFVLDEADEEKLFRKITSKLDNVADVISFRPGQQQQEDKKIFSMRWIRIAAAILFLVAGSYTVWVIATRQEIYETIAQADIEKVILEDGTIVWLKRESKLTYFEEKGGGRQASLVGEGLFEVAKDPERPFTISCGAVTVKVVGTSFNLKTGEQGVELKVLTGKVHLSLGTDQAGVDVEPNEKVIYNNLGEIKKIAMDKAELSVITERTEYNMDFRNTTMESVIDKIEKKFNVEVVVADTRVNTCRITADFTDHSLERTLVLISEFLEIEYKIKGSTVTITGKGCN